MKHEEGTFTGVGDLSLFYQSWHPETAVRAVLVIVHGLGEHSGRYFNVINHLVPKGYTIYAFDHRGHGRSPGPRGFINAYIEFRGDVDNFLQLVREREPERPLFLMGHSMGGGIVINYVLHAPEGLAGVIASAPAIGKLNVPPFLAFLSRMMSGIWPRLTLETGLDATAISRDETAVQAYIDDPLVHGKGTPRLAVEMTDNALWSSANAATWEPPLLMLHGDADRLVNVEGTRDFFTRVQQPDKKMIIYEGGYHESHNDIHYQQVVADIEAWLEAHL
ncbi:MAG: lysophospholipase [Anaerolineales bacterium]|nr:lysophospholipase [Anaerolineales bacterium]